MTNRDTDTEGQWKWCQRSFKFPVILKTFKMSTIPLFLVYFLRMDFSFSRHRLVQTPADISVSGNNAHDTEQ